MKSVVVFIIFSFSCCAQLFPNSIINLSSETKLTDYHMEVPRVSPIGDWITTVVDIVDSLMVNDEPVEYYYQMVFRQEDGTIYCEATKEPFNTIWFPHDKADSTFDYFTGYCYVQNRLVLIIHDIFPSLFRFEPQCPPLRIQSHEYANFDYHWPLFSVSKDKVTLLLRLFQINKIQGEAIQYVLAKENLNEDVVAVLDSIAAFDAYELGINNISDLIDYKFNKIDSLLFFGLHRKDKEEDKHKKNKVDLIKSDFSNGYFFISLRTSKEERKYIFRVTPALQVQFLFVV